jgi:hypothetical protein
MGRVEDTFERQMSEYLDNIVVGTMSPYQLCQLKLMNRQNSIMLEILNTMDSQSRFGKSSDAEVAD